MKYEFVRIYWAVISRVSNMITVWCHNELKFEKSILIVNVLIMYLCACFYEIVLKRLDLHLTHTAGLETIFVQIYMMLPQGSQGCQNMRQDPLNMQQEVWRAKIAPNLKNIQKCLRKQGFFDIFSSILTVFEVCVF